MAYQRHTWGSNELVTADKLNNIEEGIATQIEKLESATLITTIPSGQWSGSNNDYYITISASNVTTDSILVPQYDEPSSKLLKGPVWCVPGTESFTIHTSAIPAGTVTIMVMFVGTMGEAQYQVLDDVYSTSQVDSAIAQSKAITNVRSLLTVAGDWCDIRYAYRSGNIVYIQLWVAAGTTSGKTLVTISDAIRPVVADYCVPCLYEQAGTVANSTAWIEHANVSKVTYYGDTSTAVTRVNLMYFTE